VVQKDEPTPKPSYRSRHRSKRRREFLDIARHVINTEGQDALTMQRLTDEVGGSIGSVYYYFPTRNALLTSLQQEAFEMLLESYQRGRADLGAFLAKKKAPADVAALTEVLANCVFWVESESTMPAEIELSRRMIVGGTETDLDPEGDGVLPTALAILNEGRERLDAAVQHGVIDDGNNVERAVQQIAAMTGFLMVSRLGAWDQALFDGRRLAEGFAASSLVGWGATRDQLEAAGTLLGRFRAQHDIAPKVTNPP
jgi:AcrR family transcriptional regulator